MVGNWFILSLLYSNDYGYNYNLVRNMYPEKICIKNPELKKAFKNIIDIKKQYYHLGVFVGIFIISLILSLFCTLHYFIVNPNILDEMIFAYIGTVCILIAIIFQKREINIFIEK